MTFRDAVQEAYSFGATRTNTFVYVVLQPDGDHYWSHDVSHRDLTPESTGRIAWSQFFSTPSETEDNLENMSLEDWENWLDINAVES